MISCLRFARGEIEETKRAAALALLLELRDLLAPYLAPAAPALVLASLQAVAQVFQVELPDEQGLIIYTAILCEIPERLFKLAVVGVCRTHRYKSLPLPADFLRAIDHELWQWQWIERTVNKHIARLQV